LLLDPEVPRKPNDARVFDFLARGLADHTEETMFEGIYQLPPGSCICVSPTRGVARPTPWYRLQPADLDGQPASEAVRELLTDSVSLRLRSDVPVGTLLSGGPGLIFVDCHRYSSPPRRGRRPARIVHCS
jgi:asparagine synthase (glutamine-hydrolysing)